MIDNEVFNSLLKQTKKRNPNNNLKTIEN
jgi:hypothetical protein